MAAPTGRYQTLMLLLLHLQTLLQLLLVVLAQDAGADITFATDPVKCPGKCVSATSCPEALKSLDVLPPVSCGFRGHMPLVCCPNAPLEPGTASEPGSVGGPGSVGEPNSVREPSSVGEPNSVGGKPGGVGESGNIAPPIIAFECGRMTTRVLPTTLPAGVSQSPPAANAADRTRRAVGGEVVPSEAVWPWVSLIGERAPDGNVEWLCVGSLINQQWVLTALHCFLQRKMNVVRLGEYDYSNAKDGAVHQDLDIAEVVLHPDYVYPQAYHDLALIKLATQVTLQESIMPVCLPWGREMARNLTGQDLRLIGWGATSHGGKRSNVPNEVNMTVFQSKVCDQNYSQLLVYQKNYPSGIDDKFLCMGHPEGGKSACQGDSGGPLMYRGSDGRFVLAGTISRGYGCGLKLYPGVHTNLRSRAHLAWIKKTAFK